MNRINQLFSDKKDGILNMYFTAGFPRLDDTIPLLKGLESAGADMVEIGIPFSDPTADGPTIQESNKIALQNGMTLTLLLDQLQVMRSTVKIPVILMGYLNPVLQYGFTRFLDRCREVGVDGLILPDLPIYEYETLYRREFESRGIRNIFLVTPQTSEERIRKIDSLSDAFIYAVSTYATTGGRTEFDERQREYFTRLKDMKLKNPVLIGFGISDKQSFERACGFASGAIIGSALIKAVSGSSDPASAAQTYVRSVLG